MDAVAKWRDCFDSGQCSERGDARIGDFLSLFSMTSMTVGAVCLYIYIYLYNQTFDSDDNI